MSAVATYTTGTSIITHPTGSMSVAVDRFSRPGRGLSARLNPPSAKIPSQKVAEYENTRRVKSSAAIPNRVYDR
jgi:hypothetical protein